MISEIRPDTTDRREYVTRAVHRRVGGEDDGSIKGRKRKKEEASPWLGNDLI